MIAAELQELRPPNLSGPVRHEEHCRRALLMQLGDDVAEQAPRRVDPYDLLPPVECQSVETQSMAIEEP